jgi:SecD/SecF fusion protein
LPVAALFFFGGATLQDFAFALLIGITSGAYSSIFIAAPLVNLWKEHRDPEYIRRRGQEMPAGVRADRFLAQAEQQAAAAPNPETPLDLIHDDLSPTTTEPTTDEPATEPASIPTTTDPSEAAKLERRRQRRKARPHGRAR